MSFSSIPIRGYAKVDPSWWNALRSAGVALEGISGGGLITNTAFTFANGASLANVTGLVFSTSTGKSARAWISVRRTTATTDIYSEVELWLTYKASTASWQISDVIRHGDDDGITWSITSAGQVQYVSSSMTGGSYSGVSSFSAVTAA